MKKSFNKLLQESAAVHGHLCPGQVLGVRMSLFGLDRVGIKEPKGRDRRNLIVFVEINRCATDAIQSVTGCSLGKRTLKFVNYGKLAATFVNLATGRAVRVLARDSREKALEYFPAISDKFAAQVEAYKIMPDEELLRASDVVVQLRPGDIPGCPVERKQCRVCGEAVQWSPEGPPGDVCIPCAEGGGYYQVL